MISVGRVAGDPEESSTHVYPYFPLRILISYRVVISHKCSTPTTNDQNAYNDVRLPAARVELEFLLRRFSMCATIGAY